MIQNELTPNATLGASPMAEERIGTFLRAVYGWMAAGLALTALTASFVASSPSLVRAAGSAFWLLFIAQLGIVFFLSARVEKMAASTASVLFLVYSALTGVTLSFILLAYTGESVAMTFIITAGMFGSLAMYGTATGRSLSGVGHAMFMGLIGIILASLVGMFWHSDALQFVISCAGVVVFAGLAAYDAQRLKAMALAAPNGATGSYAVVGALALYLDFINLFLMLLRFFGNRRD
jgi:uncharacterized protein